MELLVVTASFISYLIYKRIEPGSAFIHTLLLLGLPGLLFAHLRSHYASLFVAVAVVYATYWAVILSLIVAYRLSPFHPLAKFPGPPAAKISKFWMVYVTARGDAHETVRLLHVRYGDIVRVGPNELSFCRPEAIQPILATKLKKGPYYDTRQQKEGHTTLDGIRDFSEHAGRRKPWNKALSIAALKGYEVVIIEKVEELIESLRQRENEVVDISAWMSYFGFDFMGSMAFGHEFGMMKAGCDVDGLWHVLEQGTTAAALISHIPWVLALLGFVPGSDKGLRKLQEMAKQCADRRIQAGSSCKDLFYYLTEDEQLKSTKEAVSGAGDGMLAVIAGSDTTATVLSHLWYFLLKYPACLQRLRQEIDEQFPRGQELFDFSKQADMPYLNACINEAMRLFPPVLSGLQRRVERGSGGKVVTGCFVPEETQVSVHVYTMQRDIREFSPIPDVYWPDRWLTQENLTLPSGEVIRNDLVVTNCSSFLPFSTGPQNCAGKSLAMAELRAVVCAMVQRFDMQVAKGFDLDTWEENIEDVYVTNRGSLLVNVRSRDSI